MKTCSHPLCILPVFSHLYCKNHQYLRTDLKKPQRSVLKKSERKPQYRIDWGFEDQTTLFGTLWENAKNERGYVICKYTGQALNGFLMTDMWWSCFMHVLSKSRYPYFKLNPANIEIGHPDFHKIIDQGSSKDHAEHPTWKFDLWDSKVLQMKDEYVKFKKANLLA
jgi:hypothetical protein